MEDKLNFMTTEGVETILSFDQMGIKNKRELGENDEDTNHFFFFVVAQSSKLSERTKSRTKKREKIKTKPKTRIGRRAFYSYNTTSYNNPF